MSDDRPDWFSRLLSLVSVAVYLGVGFMVGSAHGYLDGVVDGFMHQPPPRVSRSETPLDPAVFDADLARLISSPEAVAFPAPGVRR
ncbi:MAG: hypothetical protein Q7U99_18395 [Rubrivivax sp.]|nr:hypothetical protein [Rubrivivax sp.]